MPDSPLNDNLWTETSDYYTIPQSQNHHMEDYQASVNVQAIYNYEYQSFFNNIISQAS